MKLALRAMNAKSVKSIKKRKASGMNSVESRSPNNRDISANQTSDLDARDKKQMIIRSKYISKINENKMHVSKNKERLT